MLKNLLSTLTCLLFALVGASTAQAQVLMVDSGTQMQIGRYTTQATTPQNTDARPMAVIAQIHFPRSTVVTVGDAIRHTLLRTGYRLVPLDRLNPYERDFLELPLPESQRVIGPYPVNTILSTLLGEAWDLKADPLTRQVWFSVNAQHTDLVPKAPPASTAAEPRRVSEAAF
jgi:type IV pili sensor histidine kinase/response regulator